MPDHAGCAVNGSDPRADGVSVVIPTRNGARRLPRCLAAVRAQDYRGPVEIVVVDDGSTDGSLAAAQRAACGHANVQVHAKPNEGVSMARNYGTERAAGRYVMYVDADDYLSPGVLGRLTQIMDRERLDMLCFDMAGVDEHGGEPGQHHRMPAQQREPPVVGRATVHQELGGGALPVGGTGRTHPLGPPGRHIDRRLPPPRQRPAAVGH